MPFCRTRLSEPLHRRRRRTRPVAVDDCGTKQGRSAGAAAFFALADDLPGNIAHCVNRAASRGLFRRRRKAPEIYVRRCGEIGEGRPYRNRLVELLRIDFVERVVGSVVDIEIIKPVLVQRCHRHADCLQFANILAAAERRPAIDVGAKRRDDPPQRAAESCRRRPAGVARNRPYAPQNPLR